MEFEIAFYKKADGTQPALDFINELNNKMKAKVIRTIGLLKMYGSNLREPDSKHLGDGIFELRIQFGNDITRLLYFLL